MDELLGSAQSEGNTNGASRDSMDRIQRVFAESVSVNISERDLPYEQKLNELASLDSIAVLEFITAVEKEFGITMETEFLEFDFLRDLPALASYVEDRMKKRPDPSTGPGE